MAVLTVSQLNSYTKSLLDEDALLSEITVSGEISNFKRHSSGHLYLSLKDEKSAISAAMFKWQAMYLRFAPANGMKVVAKGKVTLYEPSGQYQLVISSLQPDGIGALYAAYEELKKKLESEGLFDRSRKKQLPQFPKKIGVVTSRTGAAVQDILNILGRRWPLSEIVLCPVAVQGAEAPAQLRSAVKKLNAAKACDVIIIGRGGGSIEDLWAFNDEALAREIAASDIPVISAVGHETDFTICDFAADMRAPTPSAAAELAVPDYLAVMNFIASTNSRMNSAVSSAIELCSSRLDAVSRRRCFASPAYQLELRSQRTDIAAARVSSAFRGILESNMRRFSAVAARLSALNPMEVLARGYCAATMGERLITSAGMLDRNDDIRLKFSDGSVFCRVTDIEGINENGE